MPRVVSKFADCIGIVSVFVPSLNVTDPGTAPNDVNKVVLSTFVFVLGEINKG
jgi:hypothetical protein